MKDGQKQYRILRIDEPDFGCEGRDDGEAAYDEITLVNEQGETCLVRMEEQQVWNMGLDEGMLVWVGKTDRSGDAVREWTSAAGRKNIRYAY